MSRPIGIFGRRWWPVLLAALFVVCWSSGFVGAKLGAGEAAVATVLMWRFLPLAAVLVPFVLLRRSGSPTPAAWPPGTGARHVLIGLLSQVGYLSTVYWAIGLGVSTGTTALVDGIQPLVAAALVGPLLGAAVTGRQWVGLALGTCGVLLVTWADVASPASHAPGWAYAVPSLGMLGLVASTILERRTVGDLPGVEVLTVHCATSAVVFTGAALATGAATPPASQEFWLAQVWLVVLATFGGYGLYWVLVERIGTAPVNSLMFLIAPVTAVWGAFMFGEPLTPLTVAGLALALVAAHVVVRDGSREPLASRLASNPKSG